MEMLLVASQKLLGPAVMLPLTWMSPPVTLKSALPASTDPRKHSAQSPPPES